MADLTTLAKFRGEGSTFFDATPFAVLVGKIQWVVATDRVMMVAVQSTAKYPDLKDLLKAVPISERSGLESSAKRLRALLQGGSGPTASVEELRNWAGPPEWGSEGRFATGEISPGKVLGKYWDRKKIACLVEAARDSTVQLWDTSKATEFDSLTLIGTTWRGALACIKGVFDEDVPEFQVGANHKEAPPDTALSLMDLVDP